MKNFGQKPRKIKIKKRYTLSPYVLNLTPEVLQWKQLSRALKKRVRRFEKTNSI